MQALRRPARQKLVLRAECGRVPNNSRQPFALVHPCALPTNAGLARKRKTSFEKEQPALCWQGHGWFENQLAFQLLAVHT